MCGLVLEGWTLDEQAPDRPVVLDVEVDGNFQQHVVADEMRRDLALTLGTSGRNAFACACRFGYATAPTIRWCCG